MRNDNRLEIDPRTTALLVVDLQNDFLAPDGAYARGGQASAAMAALPARLAPLATTLKAGGGLVVASRFTLWPDASGEPMIAAHLHRLRPFLTRGDFAPGSRGQAVVDALRDTVDVCVDKVAYSAFFQTQLEWVLRHAGIETVMVAGIVTNGGVASTVRDAHLRELHAIVLEDACAAFRPALHAAAIADLSAIAEVVRGADAMAALRDASARHGPA
ncbi:MAG: cysteine hydrolase [Burkholderiaceae bacterium]